MQKPPKIHVSGKSIRPDGKDEVLRSGGLQVDLAEQRVHVDGTAVSLPPKVYELLVVLLSEPKRVHSRESLFERLWPQSVLVDSNLTTSISVLRRSLSDTLRENLRTVPKVGYSWDADVERIPRHDQSHPGREKATQRGLTKRFGFGGGAAVPFPFAFKAALIILLVVVAATFWSVLKKPEGRQVIAIETSQSSDTRNSIAWRVQVVEASTTQYLRSSPRVRIVLLPKDQRSKTAIPDSNSNTLKIVLSAASDDANTTYFHATLTTKNGKSHRWHLVAKNNEIIPTSRRLSALALRSLGLSDGNLPPITASAEALSAFDRGVRAARRQDLSVARKEFEHAVDISSDFALARMELADVLIKQGYYDRAAAQFNAAATMHGLGPEAKAETQAKASILSGRTAEAALIYGRLTREFPDEPSHRLSRIETLIRDGGYSLTVADSELQAFERQSPPASLQSRFHMATARLRAAQGRDDDAFSAYRRAADIAHVRGSGLTEGEALLQMALIERGRFEDASAENLFSQSITAFRSANSEFNITIVKINELMTSPEGSTARRAGQLRSLGQKASAAGAERTAGEVLDAAAMDYIIVGDIRTGYGLAIQAEKLLASREPSLRVGPQVTLAYAELLQGRPMQSLRRLDRIDQFPNVATEVDAQLLRLSAWALLGQPIRAHAELKAAELRWQSSQLSPESRQKIACAALRLTLTLRLVREVGKRKAECLGDGSNSSRAAALLMAEVAAREGNMSAARDARKSWSAAIARMPDLGRQTIERIEVVGSIVEFEGPSEAESFHRTVPAAHLDALPETIIARYWLNDAAIAAALGEERRLRDALRRADLAIGSEAIALRREYRLIALATAPSGNSRAIAVLQGEARAAGQVDVAARSERLLARLRDAGSAAPLHAWWLPGGSAGVNRAR
jgi:DNA-binding winged helix-turn-helix (wHTH) protein